MPNAIDITNQRFGLLVAVRCVRSDKQGKHWLCQCDCGNTHVTRSSNLRNGRCQSCGCVGGHLIHGRTRGGKRDPLFITWQGMIQRCYDPNCRSYKYYGEIGITVCERWRHSFQAFYEDMGDKPSPKHSIERIDPNKGYYKENCKWETPEGQANNRRMSAKYLVLDSDPIIINDEANND